MNGTQAMTNLIEQFTTFVFSHAPTLAIATIGGVVLFGLKLAEHFKRPAENKMPNKDYILSFIGTLIFLPFLGFIVTAVYLSNGDKINSILAFQIGLTSPAIALSLMRTFTDTQKNAPLAVEDDA